MVRQGIARMWDLPVTSERTSLTPRHGDFSAFLQRHARTGSFFQVVLDSGYACSACA